MASEENWFSDAWPGDQRRGASSESARWLAKHENVSGLVGGVSLDDQDDVLALVLPTDMASA